MLDIKSIFGNNLKTLRLSLGLSQEEFAEKAGIDDKMISRIEKAHSFTSATTIAKICNGVGITPDQLLKINANFLPDDMSDKEALIMTETEFKKAFGNNIKTLRLAKKLKQEELAKSIGIAATTLSRIENGADFVKVSTIVKLCDVLETTPGFLFNF